MQEEEQQITFTKIFIENHKIDIKNLYEKKAIILDGTKIKALTVEGQDYLNFVFKDKSVEVILTKDLFAFLLEKEN